MGTEKKVDGKGKDASEVHALFVTLRPEVVGRLYVRGLQSPRGVWHIASPTFDDVTVCGLKGWTRWHGMRKTAGLNEDQSVCGNCDREQAARNREQCDNERAELLLGCERLIAIAKKPKGVSWDDAEYIALFAAAVREHLAGGK